jgi:ankyrin repeat protein
MKNRRLQESHGILKYFNAQDFRGLSPLHVAVLNRNLEVVIVLINIGVNLFLEDNKRNVFLKFNFYYLIIDCFGLC